MNTQEPQQAPVWEVLEAQGRTQKWLSAQTGIPQQRLFNLKRSLCRWRDEEAEAVSRALGVPRHLLFGAAAGVLPPGRRSGRPGRTKKVREQASPQEPHRVRGAA